MGDGCVGAESDYLKLPRYSSITIKYQTGNVEKKGFSSQAKRFTHSVNENPGPGSYLSHTSAEIHSPSISKKGTRGFASKAVRVSCKPERESPAPNTYNLQGSLVRQHDFNRDVSRAFHPPISAQTPNTHRKSPAPNRYNAVRVSCKPERESPAPNTYNLQGSLVRQHDFNRDVSRAFHPPISAQTPNTHRKSPAPNRYNLCYSGVEVNSVVSAQAAFLSKTRRSNIYPAATGPSPCHYNVNDTVIQKNPKVPSSCFTSTSARIQTPAMREGPGPGSYSPYETPEPAKRTIQPRRHYSGLSAPPPIPPKDPPLPGPGQYDIVSYTRPHTHLMTSTVFMSSTRRGKHHTKRHSVPRPGSYKPDVSTMRSFLYNHANTWVPG